MFFYKYYFFFYFVRNGIYISLGAGGGCDADIGCNSDDLYTGGYMALI